MKLYNTHEKSSGPENHFLSYLGAGHGALKAGVRQGSLLWLSLSITEVTTPTGPAPYEGPSIGLSLVLLLAFLFCAIRNTFLRYIFVTQVSQSLT